MSKWTRLCSPYFTSGTQIKMMKDEGLLLNCFRRINIRWPCRHWCPIESDTRKMNTRNKNPIPDQYEIRILASQSFIKGPALYFYIMVGNRRLPEPKWTVELKIAIRGVKIFPSSSVMKKKPTALLIINTEERLKQRLLDTCKTAVSKYRK